MRQAFSKNIDWNMVSQFGDVTFPINRRFTVAGEPGNWFTLWSDVDSVIVVQFWPIRKRRNVWFRLKLSAVKRFSKQFRIESIRGRPIEEVRWYVFIPIAFDPWTIWRFECHHNVTLIRSSVSRKGYKLVRVRNVENDSVTIFHFVLVFCGSTIVNWTTIKIHLNVFCNTSFAKPSRPK